MFPFSIKQLGFGILTALLLLTAPAPGGAKLPENSGLSNWSALIPHPLEKNKFLAAAQNSLYVTSSDFKETWQKESALPAKALEIQKLFYFPQIPENIFVMTDQGIYKTRLTASGYETIYEKRKLNERITDFAVHPEDPRRLFLGTNTGVLESKDAGKSWRVFTPAEKAPVCFLRFSAGHFFVARPDHLLVSENLSRFQKVLTVPDSGDDDFEEILPQDISSEAQEEAASGCSLRDLTGHENQNAFWLATSHGIYESKNSGLSWTNASSGGVAGQDIHYLASDSKNSRIFAAGLNRIYELAPGNNRWREIPIRSLSSTIRGISLGGANLNIVTAAGLLTHIIFPDRILPAESGISSLDYKNLFQNLLQWEPTALQIQRVVSRYHHTQNSKINRWQAESRLRALLPTVSFKKDFSFGNNIDIDRRGTNDPDAFIEGPADTSRGWDFGVGWDLGDLIFSTSQTSIDSREKLMMELRHDLTAEATRLFYERRRIQMETLFSPATTEQEHFARLLQIDELTALLDAMTNGFMSKQLELIYKQKPELTKIWEYDRTAKLRHTTQDTGHKGETEENDRKSL